MNTKNFKLIFLISFFLFFIFSGNDCASPEMEGAKLAIQQKNFPRAEENLKKELSKNPKNETAYFMLANIYVEQNRYDEFISIVNESKPTLNKHKSEIDNLVLKTWALLLNTGAKKMEENEYTSAVEFFKKSLVVNPDSEVTYRNLSIAYFGLNQKQEALSVLYNALEKHKSPEIVFDIAREHFNEAIKGGENSKSEYQEVKNIIEKSKEWNVYNKYDDDTKKTFDDILISSYFALGDTATVILMYEALLKKDPTNVIYALNHGVLLIKAEKLGEAEIQFENILKVDPNFLDAILALGEVNLKIGIKMKEVAKEKFEIASKKNKNAEMDNSYKEKIKKSVEYLEKYVNINSQNPGAWMNLGTAYAHLGNAKKSDEAYKKADELNK